MGERTSQVQLMGRIHYLCQQVVVYLGDRLDGSASLDKAPQVLRAGLSEISLNYSAGEQREFVVSHVFGIFQELAISKHPKEIHPLGDYRLPTEDDKEKVKKEVEVSRANPLNAIEAMRRMMHPPFTPWWSRIWVVQEVTVAPEILIVYGTVSMPWSMFASAATNYTKHSMTCCSRFVKSLPRDQAKVLADCCTRVLDIEGLRNGREIHSRAIDGEASMFTVTWSLLDLLRKFRDRGASDPRDKVYALLGIAPASGQPMIPDYSLSEVEVFRRATLECIYETKSLSVFSIDLGRKCRNDLPSWVPDWSAPGGFTYDARAAAAELYDACPSKAVASEDTVHSVGKMTLAVKGLWFDTITQVSSIMWGRGPEHLSEYAFDLVESGDVP